MMAMMMIHYHPKKVVMPCLIPRSRPTAAAFTPSSRATAKPTAATTLTFSSSSLLLRPSSSQEQRQQQHHHHHHHHHRFLTTTATPTPTITSSLTLMLPSSQRQQHSTVVVPTTTFPPLMCCRQRPYSSTTITLLDDDDNNNTNIRTGTVKWFDVKKGYGFIVPDPNEDEESLDDDVFVHQTAIHAQGFRSLAVSCVFSMILNLKEREEKSGGRTTTRMMFVSMCTVCWFWRIRSGVGFSVVHTPLSQQRSSFVFIRILYVGWGSRRIYDHGRWQWSCQGGERYRADGVVRPG